MPRIGLVSVILLTLVGCVGAISPGVGGTGPTVGSTADAGGSPFASAGGSAASQTGGSSGSGGAGTATPVRPAGAGGTAVAVDAGIALDAGVGVGAPGTDGGTAPSAAACSSDVVPAIVQGMVASKCVSCHGTAPLPGAPSLLTVANLKAPSATNPTKTNAAMMVTRIQSTAAPMPPAGGTPATPAELAALQDWVNRNYPPAPCPTFVDAGTGGVSGATDAGGAPVVVQPPVGPDPFGVGSVCTSKTTFRSGEGATMNPGVACVNCHRSSDEAPLFAIAGTLYATGQEPDNCNGASGAAGARVVVTGADGNVVTLTPNAAGNFTYQGSVRTPFRAKVTFMGRERLMISTQTNGDCNACHTQVGATMAPGRIVLP